MSSYDLDLELELSRSREYILKASVVPEKYAPYYARWVRKFMAMVPDRPGLTFEDRLTVFQDGLRHCVEAKARPTTRAGRATVVVYIAL